MIAPLLLLACAGEPPPPDLADGCGSPYPELRITCQVQRAAEAARAGDRSGAEAACAAVPEGSLWREECHFRAGESFARAGDTRSALSHCRRAARYARNCITHAAWSLETEPGRSADDPATAAALADLGRQIDAAMDGAPAALAGAAREELLSRAWFQVYFGTGSADPRAARAAAPDQRPYARSAFAAELIRLLGRQGRAMGALQATWDGALPAPAGAPLPERHRVGRHAPMPIPPEAADRVMVASFGGGRRLSSPDPATDLTLAGLAGLFFLDADAEAFRPWTGDERALVRDQAIAYLIAVAEDPLGAAGPYLEHPDPIARAYAREALRVRRDQERRAP